MEQQHLVGHVGLSRADHAASRPQQPDDRGTSCFAAAAAAASATHRSPGLSRRCGSASTRNRRHQLLPLVCPSHLPKRPLLIFFLLSLSLSLSLSLRPRFFRFHGALSRQQVQGLLEKKPDGLYVQPMSLFCFCFFLVHTAVLFSLCAFHVISWSLIRWCWCGRVTGTWCAAARSAPASWCLTSRSGVKRTTL
jgi:hypothetical protein